MDNFNSFNVVDNYNSYITNIESDIEKYFYENIEKKSKIDKAANQETAKEVYRLDALLNAQESKIKKATAGMILLWVFGIIAIIVGVILIVFYQTNPTTFISVGAALIVVGLVMFICGFLVLKKKKQYTAQYDAYQKEYDKQYALARSQLADIFSHFSDTDSYKIFSSRVPSFVFEDYFTTKYEPLWDKYLLNDNKISTIFAINGLYSDNPFLIRRVKKTEMFMEVYTGTRVVTVRRTGYQNGRSVSYTTTKVIVATATNPAPKYWIETHAMVLSNVIPELSYENFSSFRNEKAANKHFRKGKGTSPMDNPAFDKLFPCDRNDEVGFRTIYTPIAQENMVKLIKQFGDYSVRKDEQVYSSYCEANNEDIYCFASRYFKHFDFEALKEEFINFNKNFFSSVYLMFAPIMLIPLLIQTRFNYTTKDARTLSTYALESKINMEGDIKQYAHPSSRTENIVKVEHVSKTATEQVDAITAHGYRTSLRVVMVPVYDPEAGNVIVPVTVVDYFPVSKTSKIITKIPKKNDDNNVSSEERKKRDFAWATLVLGRVSGNPIVPDKNEIIKTTTDKTPKNTTKK